MPARNSAARAATLLDDCLEIRGKPGIVRFGPEARVVPRARDDYELWCVLEGGGEVQLDRSHPLRAGICFIFQPGDEPGAVSDPRRPLTVFYAHFDWKQHRRGRVRLPRGPVTVDDFFLLESCARQTVATDASAEKGDPIPALLSLRLLLSKIIGLSRRPFGRPTDQEMMRIAEEIRRHPAKSSTVAGLARHAGLSPPHFIRRFTLAQGLPPKRFIIKVRIDQARWLLEKTTLSIKQVATALNYRDEYYFNRQFKEAIGLPPARWRKNLGS